MSGERSNESTLMKSESQSTYHSRICSETNDKYVDFSMDFAPPTPQEKLFVEMFHKLAFAERKIQRLYDASYHDTCDCHDCMLIKGCVIDSIALEHHSDHISPIEIHNRCTWALPTIN